MCFISLFQKELPLQSFKFDIVCFVCPCVSFPNIHVVKFDKPCPISMQGYMIVYPSLILYIRHLIISR